MNSDWPEYGHHTKNQNMYLKFLTPLIPSVEKIVNFVGPSKFIIQEIQMYYVVIVNHNGMAAHLTRSGCEEC